MFRTPIVDPCPRDLPTPALIVDGAAFEHKVATMAAAHPGPRLRPHVKALKSTALARRLAEAAGGGGGVDAQRGADVGPGFGDGADS